MLHQTTNNLPQYMRPICQFIYFPFCFLSPRSSSPASGLRYAPPPNHTAEASPQRRPQLPTALPAACPGPQLPHPIAELEGGVVAEEICSGRGSPAAGPGELGDARQVAVLRARTTLFSGVSVVLYLAVVVKTHL
jgi:hypothetical protein